MAASDLLVMGEPVLDKVVRTVAVYAGMAVLLRIGGKRDLAQLNSFDLVVMLLLSNVVQNAIIGPDDSLLGGLLGAAVLVGVNAVVVRTVARDERLVRLFEGHESVLVRDGQIDQRALRREGLRRGDVVSAVLRQGADDLHDVAEARLTPGGAVVVALKPDDRNATRGDIEGLRRELGSLSAQLHQVRARLGDADPR